MTFSRRLAVALLIATATIASSAASDATTTVTPTTSPGAAAAPAIYTKAIADGFAAKSFREYATVRVPGFTSSDTEDSIRDGGSMSESVVATTTRFSFIARLVRGGVFLNGDQESLEEIAGLSTFDGGFDAGHWVEIPRTSKVYNEIAYGLDTNTAIKLVELAAPMTISGTLEYAKQKVVAISSTIGTHASSSDGRQSGHFVLYVSTGPKPLPVAEVIDDTINKVAQHETIEFSHWNEQIELSVPPSVTHIS